MSQDKKSINDYDLLMTYLNENDDKCNEEILNSQHSCQQLDSLKQDMQNIEEILSNYEPDENYGEQLWNSISDKLEPALKKTWFSKLQNYLTLPQYSLASVFALIILVGGAFMLGNKTSIENNQQLSNQLLAQNIQMHLTQTDMLLTEINNMNQASFSPQLQNTAAQLLASNRLFSMALKDRNQSISRLLNNIEMTLLELSNSNHDNDIISNNPNSQSLLFRVKSMNNKLNHQDMSI